MRWLNISDQGLRLAVVEDIFRTPFLAVAGARTQRKLGQTLLAAGFVKNPVGDYVMLMDPPRGPVFERVVQRLKDSIPKAEWTDTPSVLDVYPALAERVRGNSSSAYENDLYEYLDSLSIGVTPELNERRGDAGEGPAAPISDREEGLGRDPIPAGAREALHSTHDSAVDAQLQEPVAEEAVQGVGDEAGVPQQGENRGETSGVGSADQANPSGGVEGETAPALLPADGEGSEPVGGAEHAEDPTEAIERVRAQQRLEMLEAELQGDDRTRGRYVDDIPADVRRPTILSQKREYDLAIMATLGRVIRERREAESAGVAYAPVLNPNEKALLATFGGTAIARDERNPFRAAEDPAARELAGEFLRISASWKKTAVEEPGPAEMVSYGQTHEIDREVTPAKAARVLKYVNMISQYEVADDFARLLWTAAQRLGVDRGSVVLPNSGVGSLSRLRPAELTLKTTQVPNEPLAFEVARTLHPEDSVIGGLIERVVLPTGYYDAAIAISHESPSIAEANKKTIVVDEAVNAEPDTPPLNPVQHLIYKSMQTVRPGGIGIFVVRSDMFLSNVAAHNHNALTRVAQFSEKLSIVGLDGHVVKGMASPSMLGVALDDASAASAADVSYDLLVLRKRQEPITREAATEERATWIPAAGVASRNVRSEISEQIDRGMARRHEPNVYPDWRAASFAAFSQIALENIPVNALQERPENQLSTPGGAIVLSDTPIVTTPQTVVDGSFVLINDGVDVGVTHGAETHPYAASARAIEIIKSMIPIREAVSAVLRVQMESSDDDRLVGEQRRLQVAYERFTVQFGPLSRTSNVDVIRDDPSLPQLLALENYDIESDTATPTDFFTDRVIGAPKLVQHADSAEEALALSMGRSGFISPELISALTKRPWSELRSELADSIFMDPLEGRWVTRDQYLSGNVRAKLGSARIAASIDRELFGPNVPALEGAQPRDVEVADVDFQLGAPWIPLPDYHRFVLELLQVAPENHKPALEITYDRISARWKVRLNDELVPTRNRLEWETQRQKVGAILDATFNSRSIRITYEQERPEGAPEDWKPQRLTDHVETARVHMLQERLKDQFQRWAVENPHRAERLIGIYNERVNAYRERRYDGSYLRFERMSPLRELMPHQINGVARGIEDGNVLVAHGVGSGKSAVLTAIAMETVRMGLHRKPGLAVPNATINQMAAEVIKFYPSARVLVGDGISDRNPGAVRRFVARAAMDSWDLVLMTHETLKAIKLSAQTQLKMLERDLAENQKEQALTDDPAFGQRITKINAKLGRLRADAEVEARNPDSVYGFERMGIDLLLVDEAHLFKNVDVQTKMNVLGINTSGSDRARDMQAKLAYVRMVNGDKRGAVLATATPICNSIAELFTVMQNTDQRILRSLGIRHFDAWASTFGRVQSLIEQRPAGDGWQIRDRFIRFQNVPEMTRAFRMLADVRTDDDVPEVAAQRPNMKTELIVSPRSDLDRAFMLALERRARSIEEGAPLWKKDSVIVLMGDLSRAMLDMRMVNPDAPEAQGSIVSLVAGNVHRIWEGSRETKGTQIVFCDQGIHGKRFSLYEELRNKLVELGLPRNEIALINEHSKPHERHRLFTRMNAGRVSVLIGSSTKIGLGTNVQRKVVAQHHFDMPPRPDQLDQRIGRGHRPGNENALIPGFVLGNYVYAKEGNTRRFEILQNKYIPVKQALSNPDKGPRRIEEEVEVTLEDIQAELTNNPLLREKVQSDADVRVLDMLRRAHHKNAAVMAAEAAVKRRAIDAFDATHVGTRADIQSAKVWVESFEARVAAEMAAQDQRKADAVAAKSAARAEREVAREQERIAKSEAKRLERAQKEAQKMGTLIEAQAPVVDTDEVGAQHDMPLFEGDDPFDNDDFPVRSNDESQALSKSVKEPNALDVAFSITLQGREYNERAAAGQVIVELLERLRPGETIENVGSIGDFQIGLRGPEIEGGDEVVDRRGTSSRQAGGWTFARRPQVSLKLEDALGSLVLRGQSQHSIKMNWNYQVNIGRLINFFRDIEWKFEGHEQKVARARVEWEHLDAKSREPFPQEAEWVAAQETKARLDIALLQHRNERDVDGENALLELLRGMTMPSGRPIHPDELREWRDADQVIENAVEEGEPALGEAVPAAVLEQAAREAEAHYEAAGANEEDVPAPAL